MKYLWIALGWASVGLGIAGAFLPLLPTTPFLLLAAFAFSRGSTHLHGWLVNSWLTSILVAVSDRVRDFSVEEEKVHPEKIQVILNGIEDIVIGMARA